MTQITDLYGFILSEVPQVDAIALNRSIVNALRTFCEKTQVLRVTSAPLDVVADQAEYTLPAVADRDIVRVVRGGLWWNGEYEIFSRSEDELDRSGFPTSVVQASEGLATLFERKPWRTAKSSTPGFFFQPLPHLVRLVPIPDTAQTAKLTATYSLKPKVGVTEIDDFIVANWHETLVHGALAELLQSKNKPWSNTILGKDREGYFMDGISKVISERISGFADNDYSVGFVKAWT